MASKSSKIYLRKWGVSYLHTLEVLLGLESQSKIIKCGYALHWVKFCSDPPIKKKSEVQKITKFSVLIEICLDFDFLLSFWARQAEQAA